VCYRCFVRAERAKILTLTLTPPSNTQKGDLVVVVTDATGPLKGGGQRWTRGIGHYWCIFSGRWIGRPSARLLPAETHGQILLHVYRSEVPQ
jgi:hypothetical protein